MSFLDTMAAAAADLVANVSSNGGPSSLNDLNALLMKSAQQTLNAQAQDLVGNLIRSIEIRTGVAPPVKYTTQDLAALVPKLDVPKTDAEKRAAAKLAAMQRKVAGTELVVAKQVGKSNLLDLVRPTIIVDSPLFQKPRTYSTSHGVAGPKDYEDFKKMVALGAIAYTAAMLFVGYRIGKRRV